MMKLIGALLITSLVIMPIVYAEQTIQDKFMSTFYTFVLNQTTDNLFKLLLISGELLNKLTWQEAVIKNYEDNYIHKDRCSYGGGGSSSPSPLQNVVEIPEITYKSWKENYKRIDYNLDNLYCNGADANKDGIVDGADYTIWADSNPFEVRFNENYGRDDCNEDNNWCNETDLNEDSIVDGADYTLGI